jgi:hypothetical protein
LREYSFDFTHIDAEIRDGSNRVIMFAEWNAMDRLERDQIKNCAYHYAPADEKMLAFHRDFIRQARAESGISVSSSDFLAKLNKPFMSQAENPQSDMLRITQDAAKEMLARGDAEVYRLLPSGAEKLSPMDAVKSGGLWYMNNREFAIKRGDIGGLDRWAERTAGNILRQAERGEHTKSREPEV